MTSKIPPISNCPPGRALHPPIGRTKSNESLIRTTLFDPTTAAPTTELKKRKVTPIEDLPGSQSKKKEKLDGDKDSSEAKELSRNQGNKSSRSKITHLRNPSVDEQNTRSVKRRYSTGSIQGANMHFLPMKGTIYMKKIMSGEKTYEGRVCRAVVDKFKVGDGLRLFDSRAGWGIICKITSLDKYATFERMLRDKGVLNLLPQLRTKADSSTPDELVQSGVEVYQGFPGSAGVKRFGVMAIGVVFLEKVNQRI